MIKLLNSNKYSKYKFLQDFYRNFSTAQILTTPPSPKPTEPAPYIKRKEGWESVIGLEIHAQINTKSKLFSNANINYTSPVNTNVNVFDAAIPGTLPVINKKCIEAGVLTALSLSCTINNETWFDRKHYFYADLPAGYQITQQRKPLGINGALEFIIYTPGIHSKAYYHKTKLKQLQIEQDSGKSLHDDIAQRSLIDLNRAGIPLMELVFEPDLRDGEEAGALVRELLLILQRINTCDCKMEEGSLRVDANISVNKIGEGLGIRTEVKNLGSIRSVVNSIEYEVKRQIQVLESGGIIVNETRSFDSHTKETLPMRDKEVKQDYRFMPEPNLSPVKLIYDPQNSQNDLNPNIVNIARIMKGLKELPSTTREMLIKKYNIKLESCMIILNTTGFLNYYISVMNLIEKKEERGQKVINFLQTCMLENLNNANKEFPECHIKPETVAHIIDLIETNKVTTGKGGKVLRIIFNGDERTPDQIIADNNWYKIQDLDEIEKVCQKIIEENPKIIRDIPKEIKKRERALLSLVKKVGKETDGKFDRKTVFEIMKKCTNYKDN